MRSLNKLMPFVFIFITIILFTNMSPRTSPNRSPASDSQTQSTLAQNNNLGTIEVSGEVREYIEDDFVNKIEKRGFTLHDKNMNKTYVLNLTEDQKGKLKSGLQVKLKGKSKNNYTIEASDIRYLDSSGLVTVNPNAYSYSYFQPVPVIGEQKTIFLLVKANDSIIPGYTPEQFKTIFADQADKFMRDNSFGQVWLNPEVYGWFSMGLNSISELPFYPGSCIEYISTQLNALKINLSNYSKVVCQIWGNGGGIANMPGTYSNSGIVDARADQIPTYLNTIVHEIGHNFGLDHGASALCRQKNNFCETKSTGDITDSMGYGGGSFGATNYSGPSKERLGWLNTSIGAPYLKTISSSGIYTIKSYNSQTSSPEIIKVKLPGSAEVNPVDFFIEYRLPIDFDSKLTSTNYFITAPILHMKMTNVNEAHYLTTGFNPRKKFIVPIAEYPANDFNPYFDTHKSLSDGVIYRDYSNKVSFRTVSQNSSEAQVEVLIGELHPEPPAVTLTPLLKKFNIVQPNSTFTISANPISEGSVISKVVFSTISPSGVKTPICQITIPPYDCTITAPSSINKYTDFEVLAFDELNQASNPIDFRLGTDSTLPTNCTFKNYVNGQTVIPGETINLGFYCEDNGLNYIDASSYEFLVNGETIRAGSSNALHPTAGWTIPWFIPSYILNGTYFLEAKIWDKLGNLGVAKLTLVAGSGGAVTFVKPEIHSDLVLKSPFANSAVYVPTKIISPTIDPSKWLEYRTNNFINGVPVYEPSSAGDYIARYNGFIVLSRPGTEMIFNSTMFDKSNIKSNLSNNASYIVGQTVCSFNPPTASITGGTTEVAAGSTVTYKLFIQNVDNSSCPASTYNLSFDDILTTGLTGSISQSSVTLSPGSYTTISFTITSSSSMAAGVYSFGVDIIHADNPRIYYTPYAYYKIISTKKSGGPRRR